MYVSFFPKSDAAILIWATNYKTKIVTNGASLGMTPDEISKEVAWCDKLIAAINAIAAQRTFLQGVLQNRKDVFNEYGVQLRNSIMHHKTSETYTEAIGKELGIVGSNTDFDPATYKPVIIIEISGGGIQLKFKKRGVDGINIYRRKKGTSDWNFLSRATKSPYNFKPTLENNSQPEHWEFRSFGVVNDVEIGLPSNIVELIFGN